MLTVAQTTQRLKVKMFVCWFVWWLNQLRFCSCFEGLAQKEDTILLYTWDYNASTLHTTQSKLTVSNSDDTMIKSSNNQNSTSKMDETKRKRRTELQQV